MRILILIASLLICQAFATPTSVSGLLAKVASLPRKLSRSSQSIDQVEVALYSKNHTALREILLKNPEKASKKIKQVTPLMIAAEVGDAESFSLLQWYGAEYDPNRLLHYAADGGNIEIVQKVLKSLGFTENELQGTPMSPKSPTQLNKVFAKMAALDTLDSNGNTPLIVALKQNHYDIVDLLLKAGANPQIRGQKGYSALMWAAELNDSSITKLILQEAASRNNLKNALNQRSRDDFGNSALMIASINGHFEIVEILSSYSSIFELNAVNKKRYNALMLAKIYSHKKIYSFLGKKGLKYPKNYSQNPVAQTVIESNPELLIYELKRNNLIQFQLMTTDGYGYTPLMWACMRRNLEIVQLLLEKGADLNQQNPFTLETALDLARKNGHEEAARLLQAATRQ